MFLMRHREDAAARRRVTKYREKKFVRDSRLEGTPQAGSPPCCVQDRVLVTSAQLYVRFAHVDRLSSFLSAGTLDGWFVLIRHIRTFACQQWLTRGAW